MSAQVYSVPGQVEGRRKALGLSYVLSLTCESNVNYYKNVHHLIPPLVRIVEHPDNFQNKSVSSAYN